MKAHSPGKAMSSGRHFAGRPAARPKSPGGLSSRSAMRSADHHRVGGRPPATPQSRDGFVGWRGGAFWPGAYRDIHGQALWPQAYGRGFWAFAYDDVFAGVFWPPGYAPSGTVGRVSSAGDRTGKVEGAALSPEFTRICGGQAGLSGWSFERIQLTVQPTEAQQVSLDKLKATSTQAIEMLRAACPAETPATVTERLDAIANRLQVMLDAIGVVRRELEPFYRSLNGGQKARLDSIGAQAGFGRQSETLARGIEGGPAQNCGDERTPGFRDRTIRHIERVVGPNAAQRAVLDDLRLASSKAAKLLRASCSRAMPLTPTARLDAIEKRLAATLRAVKTISPALAKFYDSLTAAQKARFNSMSAASG
jgi:LTXXQ motif family protein